MKQTNENSFRQIVEDKIEHIVLGLPAINVHDTAYKPTVSNIKKLLRHKFSKPYNLIYQNDSFSHACDFDEPKKLNTDVLRKIILANQDKFFMIINHGNFDSFTLKQNKNCQVWDRKYFAPFYKWTHQGTREDNAIQKLRTSWFVSVLGRADIFRSGLFNWIMDQGYQKNNKISYLCYDVFDREVDTSKDLLIKKQKENFIDTGGEQKYKDLIPYNNFEGKDHIPPDNDGRIAKVMPLYDCLFNIVVETHNTKGNAFHTEKSLNAILYGHVPLVIGGEGSMKKLQDMGMIIPDYIQWSIWDDLPIDQLNYSKISVLQRQVQELFGRHNIFDISQDWYPYAIRNFNHFNNLENMCVKEEKEICRWVLTSTHNLSNGKYQKFYQ
jgi:hypothetical protein|tara:strand:+ start:1084 stop:2229 length:1146 start_codon:yes stop_codon:yes gene_type:complete